MMNELLKKYDLVLPVLPGEQRRIYRSKRKTLAVILGKSEGSTFMTAAAVRFYYIMRSLGMQATVASGARAAVYASVLAVLVVAGSSVLLLQNYIYHQGVIAVKDLQQNGVIAAAGDLKIIRNGAEIASPKAPDLLMSGDEINTGEFSSLMQFENGAVVKILKQSKVYAVSLGNNFQLDLRSGGIVSRVPVLRSGGGYEIHTPDSVVSVKGTEFAVTYRDGKTKVIVEKGTVHVKYLPDGSEYDVTEGNSSEVNGDKRKAVFTEEETLLMKGFADIQYVESIGAKSPDELQVIKDKLKASDSDGQPAKITLADLKIKYGKLDEVMLYNGRRYTGVIISRGSVYKILTPGGTVSFSAKSVKGSRVVQ